MTAQLDGAAAPAGVGLLACQPVALVPSATLSLLGGAVLAAGCHVSQPAALAVVGLVQVALVIGWVLATGLPGRIGAILIGCAAAAGSDYSANRWYEHGYQAPLAALGIAVVVMFAHQLARGVVRSRVVESLSGVAFIVIAVCALSGLLLLRRHDDGPVEAAGIAVAAGVALFVAQLVDAVAARPRFDPDVSRGLSGMITGVAAGCGAGYAVLRSAGELTPSRAAIAAGGVAALACLLSVGASFAATGSPVEAADTEGTPASPAPPGSHRLRPLAAAMSVLCLTAPAGYVLITGLAT